MYVRRLLPKADGGHRRGEAVLANHVQELHLNVHSGVDVQHVTVDDGAHPVAAGNEALPLQGGQDIPQLGAADAQLDTEHALPGQALPVGVFAVAHSRQQLGADGLGMGDVTVVHSKHLVVMKIPEKTLDSSVE